MSKVDVEDVDGGADETGGGGNVDLGEVFVVHFELGDFGLVVLFDVALFRQRALSLS
jgi:hypothetical protein